MSIFAKKNSTASKGSIKAARRAQAFLYYNRKRRLQRLKAKGKK